VQVAEVARARSATEDYRSDELDDVAAAIGRMTLEVAKGQQDEYLVKPEFKRLLVATDGSEAARQALAWACDFGKRLRAHVTAVSVAPAPEVARTLLGALPALGPDQRLIAKNAEQALAKAAQSLKAAGVPHSLELQHGPAARSIVELAKSDRSDLVILGARGHGLGERLNLGSIGTSVKHHVPCSVLIARQPPPPRRILLTTDGSQRSRVAVQVGRDLARLFGARGTLVHVVDASSYGLSRSKSLLQARMLAVQERMRESPMSDGLEARVVFGSPAPRIRRVAKEEKADLIVVGARGLGGLKSLTLGSVSDRLTYKADQSVLVVKPREA
jgi:nucleotide-binding universal stress UspA family protein